MSLFASLCQPSYHGNFPFVLESSRPVVILELPLLLPTSRCGRHRKVAEALLLVVLTANATSCSRSDRSSQESA